MKKIAFKNIFLISVIVIGLVILGITSTHAMFTVNSKINSPITLSTNFVYNDKISNVEELLISPSSYNLVTKKITINNTSSKTLNYSIWYINSDNYVTDAGLAPGSLNASSSIAPNSSIDITLAFRNVTLLETYILLGVSFSESEVVLSDNLTKIPNKILSDYLLTDFIRDSYNNYENKKIVSNNNIDYEVAPGIGLMNDRLGGTTSGMNEGNVRFYGKIHINNNHSRKNFVKIGEDLYRIIGLFKDVELANGTRKDLIKVVKNNIIGWRTFSWDSSASSINSGHGVNQWGPSGSYEGSDLMRLLNPKENSNGTISNYTGINGSLWWNGISNGNCYNGSNNANGFCSFNDTNLFTTKEQNLIENVVWNTSRASSSQMYANEAYFADRNLDTIPTQIDNIVRTNTWVGRVALMNISDYAYAVDFNSCFNKTLNEYNECGSNNWILLNLQEDQNSEWLLTSYDNNFRAFRIDKTGFVEGKDSGVYSAFYVRPSFFLKDSVIVYGGDGSFQNPYLVR